MSGKTKSDEIREILERFGREPSSQDKKDIARQKGCSKSLVNKVWMRMQAEKPKEATPSEAREAVVKVEPEEEIEVPVIEEEKEAPLVAEGKAPSEEELLERVQPRLEAGLLTSEDLTYVWQSVNQLFPKQHQRPDRSMELLGKLWVKPANRMIEKYATENIDLYLAIGATVLTFAPSAIGMIRERKEKPKKEVKSDLVG